MASQARPHWLNKKLSGFNGGGACVRSADPVSYVSTETLYDPRRQTLDLLQTIGVGNKVRRAGLHTLLKMGPNQRVIKEGKRGHV